MTTSELILTFIWILTQAFPWRPVSRTVNPENLPGELELPGVDVFICTADPEKEPVIDVMNTVLSAMALDYPSDKLAVYLSDDGGAASTMYAVKEASSLYLFVENMESRRGLLIYIFLRLMMMIVSFGVMNSWQRKKISRFSPLTYWMSKMSILQSLCYGSLTFFPWLSVSCVIYGTVPQLCFLNGIALYPKVSDPWFSVFVIVYLSSFGQHLYEVCSSGGSFTTCWNEQRIWMIRTVTACLFGCLDVLLKWLGITKASFRLTNKAIDQEKLKKYEKGIFDFQGA
ncbi:hypothetical protein RJ639_002034 [Escallonia herrerae]|uniref:Uncharacterized protein n=1 Tax=Escallonia herrerae TaxID=1293975 RepID=A0AA89BIC5_9ASTE|nr:hypothetical protein RJ639_002034 [Escallonia herrerae]